MITEWTEYHDKVNNKFKIFTIDWVLIFEWPLIANWYKIHYDIKKIIWLTN